MILQSGDYGYASAVADGAAAVGFRPTIYIMRKLQALGNAKLERFLSAITNQLVRNDEVSLKRRADVPIRWRAASQWPY